MISVVIMLMTISLQMAIQAFQLARIEALLKKIAGGAP